MRKLSPFTQSFEQLPNTLRIFPLAGAVVMPSGTLALNIFEPHYLNMVHDAMKTEQLIGMIQPKDDISSAALHKIGCAARVVHYIETRDGRLEIRLEGLCRFSIEEELSTTRGYRLIKPRWQDYQHDYETAESASTENSHTFMTALRNYFNRHDIEVDWSTIEDLRQESLVNNLVGQLALSSEDKQLLVEANSLSDRVKCFTAILKENENNHTTRH